jgi:hypothetical protein
MITFNPAERITVDDALSHPYLSEVRRPANEIVCPEPLIMQIENFDLNADRTKEYVSLLSNLIFCALTIFVQMKAEVMKYRERNASAGKFRNL